MNYDILNLRIHMINIISVGTPTIESSNKICIIDGDPVTLTCKTTPEDIGGDRYHWKLNSTLCTFTLLRITLSHNTCVLF